MLLINESKFILHKHILFSKYRIRYKSNITITKQRKKYLITIRILTTIKTNSLKNTHMILTGVVLLLQNTYNSSYQNLKVF